MPVMLPPPVYLAGGQGGLHYVDHFFGGGGIGLHKILFQYEAVLH